MRVLAVRQPWASLIIDGIKNIEIRTHKTNIRGEIAIYASRTPIRKEDIAWLKGLGLIGGPGDFTRGAILGTVCLSGCNRVQGMSDFKEKIKSHYNNPTWYDNRMHYWNLTSPNAITPVEYKMNGSIVWGNIDNGLIGNISPNGGRQLYLSRTGE